MFKKRQVKVITNTKYINPSREQLNTLLDHYKNKKYNTAENLAISLTKQFPSHHFAWKVLGALQKHTGRTEEALTSMLKSLEICPKDAEIHNNLGVTLKELCRFDEALESFNEAIVLSPNYAEAYNNLGATFHELGRLEKAEASYTKAIQLNSNYTEAYYNMGKTLKSLERFEDAIHSYTQAIELNPNFAEAYNNISVALNEQSKFEEAINFVKQAILLKPDYAEAYNNLGISLKEQGKFEEAINALNQAILIKPNYFEAYWNLGNVFNDQSKLEKGIMAHKKALSIKPDYEIGRATLLFELAYICDWETIKENIKLIPKLGTKNQFISPFSLLALEDAPERHFLRSKIYSKGKYSQNILPLPNRSRKISKRIRIGYFSADFREHPVAFLILRVLELHDRNKFEVFGYSLFSSSKSEIRQRLESSFDHFVDIQGMSDKDKALRAKEDEIDIAIDLTGYTENNCNKIFAYRIAPIQINYLGFPGTMGATYFDYIVADQYLIPPENQKNFTEKQIYLPNTYMPTDNTREISKKYISKKKFGLPEDSFIFCCFNNHYKITTEEFDIWMNFLRKLDNSFLWLSKSNYVSEANLKKEAIKRDIDSSRLIFAERVPIKDHLARYKLADIFLDTFNFNAHTTACEALWGGLPVITKVGKGFPARVASSLLNAINLPELITNNKKEYEDLVLELANNPKKLSNLKEKLANNRLSQPLFNTEQYTKFLEDGYKQAYLNNLKGNIAKNIIAS